MKKTVFHLLGFVSFQRLTFSRCLFWTLRRYVATLPSVCKGRCLMSKQDGRSAPAIFCTTANVLNKFCKNLETRILF